MSVPTLKHGLELDGGSYDLACDLARPERGCVSGVLREGRTALTAEDVDLTRFSDAQLDKLITEALTARTLRARRVRPKLIEIAQTIAAHHGTTVGDIRGVERTKPFIAPRQHFMVAARAAGYGYTVIGRFLNRDHATVFKGIQSHQKRAALRAVEVAA